MVLKFSSFKPYYIPRQKSDYKSHSKKKHGASDFKTSNPLTTENRLFLKSLGFKVLV